MDYLNKFQQISKELDKVANLLGVRQIDLSKSDIPFIIELTSLPANDIDWYLRSLSPVNLVGASRWN